MWCFGLADSGHCCYSTTHPQAICCCACCSQQPDLYPEPPPPFPPASRSGELFFFGYSFEKAPYLTVGVMDAKGELVRQVPVDLPWPAMMHDMALSKSYMVLLHLPLTVDGEVGCCGRTWCVARVLWVGQGAAEDAVP